MPAPGLRGLRTKREDVRTQQQHQMQKQQHGLQMARGRQDMQATAQQMRQRRLQIEDMERQSREWEKNSNLRGIQREAEQAKARLERKEANHQIDNWEAIKERERIDAQLDQAIKRSDYRSQQLDNISQENENLRDVNDYIANQIPEDPSKLTQRRLNRVRKQVRSMGYDPDDVGLPERANAQGIQQASYRRNLAVRNVEAEQERDQTRWNEEYKESSDRIIRRQNERSRLINQLNDIDDPDSDAAKDLRRRISELPRCIETDKTIVGRTEQDFEATSGQELDLIERVNNADRMIDDIDEMKGIILEDPTRAGAPGQVRGMGQVVSGAIQDISTFLDTDRGSAVADNLIEETFSTMRRDAEAGRHEEDFLRERGMFDPELPRIRKFEISMAYRLARLNKGPGRLNQADFDNARRQVQITGATSSQEVIVRLNDIQEDARRRREDAMASRQGMPRREYLAEREEQDERVQGELALEEFNRTATQQYGVEVKQTLRTEDGTSYAELNDGRIMDKQGTIVDDPSFPNAIRDIGVQHVEEVLRDTQNDERVYRLDDGRIVNKEGREIQ